jgi:hypothetical protein
MNSEIINKLVQPLPVKTTEGRNKFNYVDGDDVRRKLNEAFNYDWSEELIDASFGDNGAIVKLYIVVKPGESEIRKFGIGQSDTSGNSALGIGDAFKTAHTNAVKDAAKGFGIGLGVKGMNKATASVAQSKVETQKTPVTQASSQYTGSFPPFASDLGIPEKAPLTTTQVVSSPETPKISPLKGLKPATDMQVNALRNISKKNRLSPSDVVKAANPSLDIQEFEALSLADASVVIKHWRSLSEGA